MCYSNENRVYTNIDIYDCEKYEVGQALSDSYYEGGGTNLALTWTSYLTDNLSMKLMHGRTERTSVSGSPNDMDCNYVSAGGGVVDAGVPLRSEEHTSELQSLMRQSCAVFCLNKKNDEPNSETQY